MGLTVHDMNDRQRHRTDWIAVWLSIAAGIVAALQIGKVPPAIPLLQQDLQLSLVQAGWLASMVNVIGAVAGVLIGGLADRFNYRRTLIASTLLLLAGSLSGALAADAMVLFLSRVGESFGLVIVAVAAPGLIASCTRPEHRRLALGAWSMYIPTGFAIGMVMGSVVTPWAGWRGLWLTNALILLTYLLIFCRLTAPARRNPLRVRNSPWWTNVRAVIRAPGLWLLAGIFSCYTVQWFALTTWMPTFLSATAGFSVTSAVLAGALVVLVNVSGNLSGAWLLHRGVGPWWLIAAALVFMALCGYGIFTTHSAAVWKIGLAVVFSAAGGLLPAALLSTVALHAPTASHIATANGFIVQGSHMGILAGAPLLAALVSTTGGWQHTWWLLAASGTIGLILALALRHLQQPKL